VHNDAELIALLADEQTKDRFRRENPQSWVDAMAAV
jgi:hypothetical protein